MQNVSYKLFLGTLSHNESTTVLVTLSFLFNFLVCVDSPDCASIVENDRELCKKREDYMKENCPQSCGFCGKIT